MRRSEQALALAELGFYVFPIAVGQKAPPAMKNWQEWATRDPHKILSCWGGAMSDHNIGISTSKFGDDGKALLVVDVDNKGDKRGDETITRLELEGYDFPASAEQRTPTGGRHIIYAVSAAVRQGANVLGPGVDIRSRGGYIVGAGSTIGSGAYTLHGDHVTDAPQWLVERCGEADPQKERVQLPDVSVGLNVDANSASQRAVHYLENEAPLAVEGEGGDETTYKVACRLKDLGLSLAHCVLYMLEHWNDRCSPPWDREDLKVKIKNAYAYGRDPVGVAAPEAVFDVVHTQKGNELTQDGHTGAAVHPFDTLNKDFAFVLAGGGAHILWETKDPQGRGVIEHLSQAAFHDKFAAWEISFGKKTSPVTKEWMRAKTRRSYDGICFEPGAEADPRFYNLWRGFAVEPAATATHHAVDSFLTHAKDNVCRGDAALFQWLIGYFAHLVQRPWEKPLVALVFRGGKGVGKNALIERIGGLLGSHFILTSNRRYLIGNFNGHLENLLMFALDEAFWSGDKQAEGQLKDLITGKEHVIEHKGKEPYTVANRTRVAIIGNEEWIVPSSHDERRFAVFDVGDGRKQDRNYFQSMREGMEAGGYAALLRFLLDYDLSGIDVNEAPQTQALLDQKHSSLESVEKWWLDCLHNGHIVCGDFEQAFGGQVETTRLRAAFGRYAKERRIGGWLPDDRAFGRRLKKVCGALLSTKARVGGHPTNVYKLPSLAEARTLWDTHIGHAVEWDTES